MVPILIVAIFSTSLSLGLIEHLPSCPSIFVAKKSTPPDLEDTPSKTPANQLLEFIQ